MNGHDRALRVLQFGRFWNEQHGGVERHAALLSRALAAHGVEVVNLVAAADMAGGDELVDGYRLVQAPSLGKLFSTAMAPALVQRALRLHRERPFDVFHLHFPDPLTHLASICLPRDVPRVITWHSDIVRQKRLLRLYKPWMERETLGAAALVAATHAHFDTSTQIPRAFPAGRKLVIPYGMDYSNLELTPRTTNLRDALRARMTQGLRADGALVFALGRHVSYKGFDVLLKAMRHTSARLILGGDGPLRPELEQLSVSLGLQDRVQFPGRIPEADLGAYFHACDFFCLPSVTVMEAFGLVQLEAMACGKPVICTQLNNGVNIVNQDGVTGLAVPPSDEVALGEAIQRLSSNTAERHRLAANALTHAHLYSLDAMARQHIELYQRLLATRA